MAVLCSIVEQEKLQVEHHVGESDARHRLLRTMGTVELTPRELFDLLGIRGDSRVSIGVI